jgi:hypothetical protein
VIVGRLSHKFLLRSRTSERNGATSAKPSVSANPGAASWTPLEALWGRWRFAALEADISFQEWCDAPAAEKELAYAVHRDALRREQAAAVRLAERCAASSSIAI